MGNSALLAEEQKARNLGMLELALLPTPELPGRFNPTSSSLAASGSAVREPGNESLGIFTCFVQRTINA